MEMSTEPDVTSPRRVTRAGDYDLLRRMGSGGFGVVFEARHRHTGLPYAVKRVQLSTEDAQRFQNEALYPARIASESLHVVGVHSFFHDPVADAFYLVTELIPHGDLRTFLQQQPKPLPLGLALQVASGIAKGLAAIHAQGIVHRDLKPANVLMDRKDSQWVPKIADFGLARSNSSVSIGEFASSGYAAPEQLDLLSPAPIGPEADLFSFGMILYELLTGRSASGAADLREYGRWIAARRLPPAPTAVRPDLARLPSLESLLASVLVFDRAQRTTTALQCVKVLQHALTSLERSEPQTVLQPIPTPVPVPPPVPPPTPIPAPAPPPMPGPAVDRKPPAPVPAPAPAPPLPERRQEQVVPLIERRHVAPSPTRGPLVGGLVVATLVGFLLLAVGGWWMWSWYQLERTVTRGIAAYEIDDYNPAFTLLRQASDAGHPKGQAYLGLIYVDGLGVAKDFGEAKRWFDRSASQGEPAGHAGLGYMALFGYGMPRDLPEGIRQLRTASDGGDPIGLRWLGWAYETGTGVPRDDAEALKRYRQAADAGSNRARIAVGRFYRQGRGGVAASLDDSIKWIQPAADKGYVDAQCELGHAYRERFEVARRAATPEMSAVARATHTAAGTSVTWYRKAAEKKAACGEGGLGQMYAYGYGVAFDYNEAVRWLELAVDHGDAPAKETLTALRSNWGLFGLMWGSWTQVYGADRRAEIDRLRTEGVLGRLGTEDVRRIRRSDLEFYPGVTLWEAEIGRQQGGSAVLGYLRTATRRIALDGTAPAIHELNASGALRIDTYARALAYARFYMAAVAQQRDRRPVRLLASSAELPWLDSASSNARNAYFVASPSLTQGLDGGWQGTIGCLYGADLMRLTLAIPANGTIRVISSDHSSSGLPVTLERFDERGLRGVTPPAS
jgi:serine/threonine protein kinase/TPR repeat protein